MNQKMKENIGRYNAISGKSYDLPETIDFDQVKSPDSAIWETLLPNTSPSETARSTIPLAIKQQATRLFCLQKRAIEEQTMVRSEMFSTLQWYQEKCLSLLDTISDYSNAEKCALVKEGLYLESAFNALLLAFQPYLPDTSLNALYNFSAMVGLSEAVDVDYLISENTIDSVDCEAVLDFEEYLVSDFDDSDEDYNNSDLIDYIQHLK